jgi:hypothetical protein
MFAVNSRDYPSSISRAVDAVEAALKSDPNSEDLKRLGKKLEALKPHV